MSSPVSLFGAGNHEHEGFVQHLAGPGMLDLPERGEARLGQRRRHPFDRLARRRPRDADDSNPGPAVPLESAKMVCGWDIPVKYHGCPIAPSIGVGVPPVDAKPAIGHLRGASNLRLPHAHS